MYIKKLAINHALGFVLNDDSDFDGVESFQILMKLTQHEITVMKWKQTL